MSCMSNLAIELVNLEKEREMLKRKIHNKCYAFKRVEKRISELEKLKVGHEAEAMA